MKTYNPNLDASPVPGKVYCGPLPEAWRSDFSRGGPPMLPAGVWAFRKNDRVWSSSGRISGALHDQTYVFLGGFETPEEAIAAFETPPPELVWVSGAAPPPLPYLEYSPVMDETRLVASVDDMRHAPGLQYAALPYTLESLRPGVRAVPTSPGYYLVSWRGSSRRPWPVEVIEHEGVMKIRGDTPHAEHPCWVWHGRLTLEDMWP